MIRVLERLALMGPNLYAHRPCIKWKIDLGPLEEKPSNAIPNFPERVKELLPSLIEHRCSEGIRGGFFSRLDDGTWLGHVMEHIALELQSLIGVNVGFGKTRGAGPTGVYNVVYECEDRETGILAGEIALDLIEHLVAQQPFPIAEKLAELRETNDRNALGPSTRAIVDAATRRGIPHIRLDQSSFVQLGYGARAKRIQATIASTTSHIGVEIAGDKDLTKSLLGMHGVPVPHGETCRSIERALEIANDLGWPVVVKPLDASQGRGIATNIRDEAELRAAFEEAQKHRTTVVIERHLEGGDYRLLVINRRFVAAAQRVPANVIGDGKSTIRELVEVANRDPRRGESHEKVLTRIKIDCSTERLLAMRGLTADSVPRNGEVVYLKTTANLSTGGTAVDVTDRVHPANIELAERIACLVDLDIAGIDVVAPSIEVPLEENGGGIVEVNAAPGLRMHLAPTEGKPRPVGEAIVDMLFPPGAESRIPIITITGTNGKTTTARLCAHIARQAGKCVGLTTTEGIYIRDRLVQRGDTTGPASAAVVLRDPSVNFAVLETARGGILRAGVGYDWANAAVVTNIAEDHLGTRDVDTLEDLANVKAVTVERVLPEGFAILNAEDAMTPLIRKHAESAIAFFSTDPHNDNFRAHVAAGGLGATVESGWIVLYDKSLRFSLCEVNRVPITFGGKARFNIANALAAALATYATKIPVFDITAGLLSFFQSEFTTPGRINFFDFGDFRVLLDYAHNAAALASICSLVRELRSGRLIAVFGLPGDRRDSDLRTSTRAIASTFDKVIIREDHDLRGREPGRVPAIIRAALREAGMREEQLVDRHDETEAVRLAVRDAEPGDLVVLFVDEAQPAIRMIEELRRTRRGVSSRQVADAAR
ncbi:MAG TPA: cyanophycin synthetase [Thermoanaerobaculia bacterium]|jgi:cyanophycin synthetase|nr:cyanophycin synthetase [Thermoanaerobaculia bacterium]